MREQSVLVVDDNSQNLDVANRMLSGCGYKLYFAKTGQACLDIVKNIQPMPNLILMDVEMPGLDGFETCQRLKADDSTRHIPVIFITGRDTIGDKLRGFTVGGDDYITKPVGADELIARVDTRLRLQKMVDETAEMMIRLRGLIQAAQADASEIADAGLRESILGQLGEMDEILAGPGRG